MRAYINEQGVQGHREVIRRYYKKLTFTEDSTWTVPSNVSSVDVDCVGAKGQNVSSGIGGNGGRVQCLLSVKGGETLYITVGTIPTNGATASYNASDIRIGGTEFANRVVVSGGGGGASYSDSYGVFPANGGAGGGLIGSTGTTNVRWGYSATGGAGGTQSAGGSGGTASAPYSRVFTGGTGSFGLGGNGDTGSGIACCGGAGWYGGGGGATSSFADEKTKANAAGGAGGGSSYTDPDFCSEVVHTQGFQNGNGYVTMEYEVSETDEYDYFKDEIKIKLIK